MLNLVDQRLKTVTRQVDTIKQVNSMYQRDKKPLVNLEDELYQRNQRFLKSIDQENKKLERMSQSPKKGIEMMGSV